MTLQEMARSLRGTYNERKDLLDSFINRLLQGQTLSDSEVIIFEAVKNILTVNHEIIEE